MGINSNIEELNGKIDWFSDGKYRYNEVLISIDTSGTVIDKYRYFPFILFLVGMFAP